MSVEMRSPVPAVWAGTGQASSFRLAVVHHAGPELMARHRAPARLRVTRRRSAAFAQGGLARAARIVLARLVGAWIAERRDGAVGLVGRLRLSAPGCRARERIR